MLQTVQGQGSLLLWLEFGTIPASIGLLTVWGLEVHQFHTAKRPCFSPRKFTFLIFTATKLILKFLKVILSRASTLILGE